MCALTIGRPTLCLTIICSPGQALPADTVQFTQQRRPPAYTLAPYRIYTLACTYAHTEATLTNRKGIASCSSRRTVAPTPTVARGMTRRGVPLTHSPQPKLSATLKTLFNLSSVLLKRKTPDTHLPIFLLLSFRPLGDLFEPQKWDSPPFDKQFRWGSPIRFCDKLTKITYQCNR